MKSIVLTGMSGSGKTTAGKLLADILKLQHADIDFVIEQKENIPIKDIFALKGEEYFRELEAQTIKDFVFEDNVISLGGGAFENSLTRNMLLENSVVFYLKTSPETILKRLINSNDRPLLKDMTLNRIKELIQKREPNYKLAHHTILTDNKSPLEIAKEILKCLN